MRSVDDPDRHLVGEGAAIVAIAGTFAALLAWTWRTWPDVLVDFGRELYVAWQLSGGKTLYADVAYLNGPLSPYFNAAGFSLFGASLSTLVGLNLAVLVGVVVLLYRLLREMAGLVAAATAVVVFLMLFAFPQFTPIGNYNYISPYSHEATHGTFLGLAALAALQRWRRRGAWPELAGAGLCIGLAALTKLETAVATLAAASVAFRLHASGRHMARAQRARSGLILAAAAAMPLLAAFLLLATELPAGTALRSTLAAWHTPRIASVAVLPFYRRVMGLDDASGNFLRMVLWSSALAALLAPALALSMPRPRPRRGLVAAFALRRSLVQRDDPRGPLIAGLATFALTMLAKMLLNARLGHYGFVLAMPATMLLICLLVGWIPQLLTAARRSGGVFRAASLSILAVVVAGYLQVAAGWVARKQVAIGTGSDAFRADARGLAVQIALDWLADEDRKPGASRPTLAVLPEGVMINYLSRIENPTPYVNFMPPELLLFGEDRMIDAFRAHPPQRIVLVHKDTGEYGTRLFGTDYGRGLFGWITENYRVVRVVGDPPLQPETRFGLALLERNGPGP